jgi:hypothetical protein
MTRRPLSFRNSYRATTLIGEYLSALIQGGLIKLLYVE